MWEIKAQKPKFGLSRVVMEVHINFPDNIRADLLNKVQSIEDLLVDLGVIKDDNWKCLQYKGITGSYNKENPGAIIKIYESI